MNYQNEIESAMETFNQRLEAILKHHCIEVLKWFDQTYPKRNLIIYAGGMGSGISYTVQPALIHSGQHFYAYDLDHNVFWMNHKDRLLPLIELDKTMQLIMIQNSYPDLGVLHSKYWRDYQ